MNSVGEKLKIPQNILSPKILIPLVVISLFSIGSFAASGGISTTTLQEQYGVAFSIAGGFTGADNGFATSGSTQTASTQPCTWTNGAVCRSALTGGDWRYQTTLTINAGAQALHTYTVNVLINGAAPSACSTGITFTTGATITAGQTMIFRCDTGLTSLSTVSAIDVNVA